MKLAIISHTEHYLYESGSVVGWGPTVREINHLAAHFDKIYHVACLHKGIPPPSSLSYIGDNIEFVPIPASGGDTFWAKLSVLQTMPEVIRTVSSVISEVDFFQLRLPTGMGNYLLPWLMYKKPKAKFWFKYAGNWAPKNPPLGYAFQRWFLAKNFLKCKVTINGRWPGQPSYIFSFENPCLTEQERVEGAEVLKSKNYEDKLDFAFVGQLTESKGVGRVIKAFQQMKGEPRVGFLHLVGNGPSRARYEQLAREYGINCRFYGFLTKEEVNKVLASSHALLLPSESEGLPKVIAEGANYGCIPIASAVSSIPQYLIDNINGFLLPSLDTDALKHCIDKLISLGGNDLRQIALKGHEMGHKFTYDYYNRRISVEILGLDNQDRYA